MFIYLQKQCCTSDKGPYASTEQLCRLMYAYKYVWVCQWLSQPVQYVYISTQEALSIWQRAYVYIQGCSVDVYISTQEALFICHALCILLHVYIHVYIYTSRITYRNGAKAVMGQGCSVDVYISTQEALFIWQRALYVRERAIYISSDKEP